MRTGSTLREALSARAAEIALGVSPDGLDRLIADGLISPAGHIAGASFFWMSDVDRAVAKTAEDYMPVIEAAHTLGMQPIVFCDLMSQHGIPFRCTAGSQGFCDSDIRRFAAQHGIPYRTEPDDPDERNKYRQQARMVAARARRTGRLKKSPCAACGDADVHGHHHDYTRPLDVTWLCNKCHSALHARRGRKKKYGPYNYSPAMSQKDRRKRRQVVVSLALSGEPVEALSSRYSLSPATILQYIRNH